MIKLVLSVELCLWFINFGYWKGYSAKGDIAGRQLLPRFSYQGFDPRFQTVGFKTGHFNHVKSTLFLYPILK